MIVPADRGQRPGVVVTGGTGFIGSRVVARCAQAYRVFALDNSGPSSPLPAGATFEKVDVTSDRGVEEAMRSVRDQLQGAPLASVVHLAAYYDFSGEPSDLYEEVTVRGTQRLLRAAVALDAEQFLFSSTMLVHRATQPGKPIREDSPVEPTWDYPESKLRAERLISAKRGRMPVVMLRIAGVYSDVCDSIPIANQIQRIHERRMTSRVFPGDTSHGQAFVHIDDTVQAIWLAIEKRRDLPEDLVLLIGEPETYSYGTLQRELGRLIHDETEWSTTEIPKAVAKAGAWVQDKLPGVDDPFIKPWMIDLADEHFELDVGRARVELGWEPRRRLIDTLPSMVETLRRDPAGWYAHHKLTPGTSADTSTGTAKPG